MSILQTAESSTCLHKGPAARQINSFCFSHRAKAHSAECRCEINLRRSSDGLVREIDVAEITEGTAKAWSAKDLHHSIAKMMTDAFATPPDKLMEAAGVALDILKYDVPLVLFDPSPGLLEQRIGKAGVLSVAADIALASIPAEEAAPLLIPALNSLPDASDRITLAESILQLPGGSQKPGYIKLLIETMAAGHASDYNGAFARLYLNREWSFRDDPLSAAGGLSARAGIALIDDISSLKGLEKDETLLSLMLDIKAFDVAARKDIVCHFLQKPEGNSNSAVFQKIIYSNKLARSLARACLLEVLEDRYLTELFSSAHKSQDQFNSMVQLFSNLPELSETSRLRFARLAIEHGQALTLIPWLTLFGPDIARNVALEASRVGLPSRLIGYMHFVPQDVRDRLAQEISANGGTQDLLPEIKLFSRLGLPAARDILATRPPAIFFENLSSFKLKLEEWAQLIELLMVSGHSLLVYNSSGCIPEEALSLIEEKWPLKNYRRDIGLYSNALFRQYRELWVRGDYEAREEMAAQARSFIREIVSNSQQRPALQYEPGYSDIVRQIYPQHFSSYGNGYEQNESCRDRSFDMDGFRIRPAYNIDLGAGVEMRLSEGKTLDNNALKTIEEMVRCAQAGLSHTKYDPAEMVKAVTAQVEEASRKAPALFKTLEERLFYLFLESQAGKFSPARLKEFLVAYHFAGLMEVQAFLNGTRSKAEASKNPEYSYLLLLREYFADTLHESGKKILAGIPGTRILENYLAQHSASLALRAEEDRIQDVLNRFQPHRLGTTPGLTKQLATILKQPSRSPQESVKKKEAINAIIFREQKKIAAFFEELCGAKIEPGSIHLEEFDSSRPLESATLPAVPAKSSSSPCSVDVFRRAFLDVFQDELNVLDRETVKFHASQKTERKALTLLALITKNHTSAHARGVGGVCVAEDNPLRVRGKGRNLWDLPNFFQMVLHDPVTFRCEGLVLLHHYTDQGKKVLTASFNPTSTYLYKVNEQELFQGLLGALIEFAKDNHFDIIACSRDRIIRTNRTGGEFELAMKQAIKKKGRVFKLSKPEHFSFCPEYRQQELDVLWERADAKKPA